jgi:hypothetical protein
MTDDQNQSDAETAYKSAGKGLDLGGLLYLELDSKRLSRALRSIYRDGERLGNLAGFAVNAPLPGAASIINHALPEKIIGGSSWVWNSSIFNNSGLEAELHEYSHALTNNILFDPTLHQNVQVYVNNVLSNTTVPIGSVPYSQLGLPPAVWSVTNSMWENFASEFHSSGLFKALLDLLDGKDTQVLPGSTNAIGEFQFFSPDKLVCNGMIVPVQQGQQIVPQPIIDPSSCVLHTQTHALGSVLGEFNDNMLVFAGGTMGEMIFLGLTPYLIGRMVKKKSPFAGGFAQMFSFGSYMNAVFYPVNSAIDWTRGNTSYGGDWQAIMQYTGVNPWLLAGTVAAIYPTAVLGLYLRDKRNREAEARKGALERLLSTDMVAVEKVDKLIANYGSEIPRKAINLPKIGRLEMSELPLVDKVLKLRSSKKKDSLSRYKISGYGSLEESKSALMEQLEAAETVVQKIKIKREIRKLKKVRKSVLDHVLMDEDLGAAADREAKVYGVLSDGYLDFKYDPDGFSRNLEDKLNAQKVNMLSKLVSYVTKGRIGAEREQPEPFTVDQEGLRDRLSEYYENPNQPGLSVIYGGGAKRALAGPELDRPEKLRRLSTLQSLLLCVTDNAEAASLKKEVNSLRKDLGLENISLS